MSAAGQLQFPFFASLDFPGRTVLSLPEIAERIGVSVRHLLNEIDAGAFGYLDVKGAGISRRSVRVPIESYRNYICARFHGSARIEFLKELPEVTRMALAREILGGLPPAQRRFLIREFTTST